MSGFIPFFAGDIGTSECVLAVKKKSNGLAESNYFPWTPLKPAHTLPTVRLLSYVSVFFVTRDSRISNRSRKLQFVIIGSTDIHQGKTILQIKLRSLRRCQMGCLDPLDVDPFSIRLYQISHLVTILSM